MDKLLNRVDEFVGHISVINTLVTTLLSRAVPNVRASAENCGNVCYCLYNPRFNTSDVQFYYFPTPSCGCGYVVYSGNAC